MAIGDPPEQPAANGTHQKASGEDAGGLQELSRGVAGREKDMGEINGTKGVNVEIEPFNKIAGRCANDGPNAPDTPPGRWPPDRPRLPCLASLSNYHPP